MDTGALPANEVVDQMLVMGALINAPRAHTLRLMPALNVQQDEITLMLSMLGKVLANLSERQNKGVYA